MPILAVDEHRGTFDVQCGECGLIRRGLRLDPAAGDVRVNAEARSLTVRSCPTCRARGVHVSEHLSLNHTGFEAQEDGAPLPAWSLVGTLDERNGAVVSEHHIGTHHDPFRVQQARLTRAMQRHPHLAQHAPLHEQWAEAHPHGVHNHDALDGMATETPKGRGEG